MPDEPRVVAIEEPGPAAARELIADGIDRGAVVTVVGECEVDYVGRATSYLGPGDRLVVLKPDGTLLVHTDTQRTPVNWQPPGCAHEVSLTDGRVRIVSVREAPSERIEVRFDRVFQASALDLREGAELELQGGHDDLRRRILDDPDLVEEGFRPLSTERDTSAGPVDVYGEDADGNAVAVEIKRRRAGPDAVGQLDRYVEALERDLHAGRAVRGVLVSPSVTDRARSLLDERGHGFVSLSPRASGDRVDGPATDADSRSGAAGRDGHDPCDDHGQETPPDA